MVFASVFDRARLCALHSLHSLGSGNVQVSQQRRLGCANGSGTRQHGTHSGSTVESPGKMTNGAAKIMEGWKHGWLSRRRCEGCIPHANRIA